MNKKNIQEIFEKNNESIPLTPNQILEMTTNAIVEDIRTVQSQRDRALHQITQSSKALSMEDNAYMIESYMKDLNRYHVEFAKYNAELEKLKIYKFQMTGEI